MTTKTSIVKIILLAAILAVGVSYANAVGTWTVATQPAPNGNTDAPINVGTLLQSKAGPLVVNVGVAPIGFQTWGKSIFNGAVQIVDGTQGSGKVLTSDTDGNASWQTISTSPQTTLTFDTSGSWTVPAGVTSFTIKLWGAGAGGNASCVGGSGGAGGYGEATLSTTPGTVYNFTVGLGGTGQTGNSSPAPYTGGSALPLVGGNTVFNTSYIAYGGNPPSTSGVAGTGGSASSNLTNVHTGAVGLAGNNQYGGAPWGWTGAKTGDPTVYIPGGGGGSGNDDGVFACDGYSGYRGGNGRVVIQYGGTTGASSSSNLTLCTNNSTAAACVAAKSNGGSGDSHNRVLSCLRSDMPGIVGLQIIYSSNKWQFYKVDSTLQDCTDGSALVATF